eukprot:351776-Chlamydomonas_euryale.AAC.11
MNSLSQGIRTLNKAAQNAVMDVDEKPPTACVAGRQFIRPAASRILAWHARPCTMDMYQGQSMCSWSLVC